MRRSRAGPVLVLAIMVVALSGCPLLLFFGIDLRNPVAVEIDGVEPEVDSGSTILAEAITSEPVDSYQWYLDGNTVGGDAAQLTIAAPVQAGPHRLHVVVALGSRFSSAEALFDVVEE